MSIINSELPFNLNLEKEIPAKKINFIKNAPIAEEVSNVISNSFGFGGTNVSLSFKKYAG